MTWGPIHIHSLDTRRLAELGRRIDTILRNPEGLPDGKGKRTKLTLTDRKKLKSAFIEAAEKAAVWASIGRLPNRAQGVGRPPDNAIIVFIDDIIARARRAD